MDGVGGMFWGGLKTTERSMCPRDGRRAQRVGVGSGLADFSCKTAIDGKSNSGVVGGVNAVTGDSGDEPGEAGRGRRLRRH